MSMTLITECISWLINVTDIIWVYRKERVTVKWLSFPAEGMCLNAGRRVWGVASGDSHSPTFYFVTSKEIRAGYFDIKPQILCK